MENMQDYSGCKNPHNNLQHFNNKFISKSGYVVSFFMIAFCIGFCMPVLKKRRTPSPVHYVFVDSAMNYDPYSAMNYDPSLSSESSQLSSGYYSGSSYSESISSRSSQLSYPKDTPKCMPEKAEKDNPLLEKPAIVSSSPIQATSTTIKHSDSSQDSFMH